MDDGTLRALRGSIEKWKRIEAGTDSDMGSINCPLCQMFMVNKREGSECVGCPVAEKVENYGCVDTPHQDYVHDRTIENARKEREFLESLLPEGEKP